MYYCLLPETHELVVIICILQGWVLNLKVEITLIISTVFSNESENVEKNEVEGGRRSVVPTPGYRRLFMRTFIASNHRDVQYARLILRCRLLR